MVSPLGAAMALAILLCVSTPLTFAFRGTYTLPIGRSIDAACACAIVLAMTRHPASLAGRLLNTRVLVHVGVLSYSLYLWQQLFLTSLNTTWTGRLPVSLLCAYLAALTSYLVIEKPFLALKKRTRHPAVAANPEPPAGSTIDSRVTPDETSRASSQPISAAN